MKSAIPTRNSRRCPNRSPSRPPSSRKPPKVSRYAFTTQASEVSEKPRSSRIDGSATFTIVVSRTIIRSPRQRTIRAIQRAACRFSRSSASFRSVSTGSTGPCVETHRSASDEFSRRVANRTRSDPDDDLRRSRATSGTFESTSSRSPGKTARASAIASPASVEQRVAGVAYCELAGVEPDPERFTPRRPSSLSRRPWLPRRVGELREASPTRTRASPSCVCSTVLPSTTLGDAVETSRA